MTDAPAPASAPALVGTGRPPLRLAITSLLRADGIVLLHNRVSGLAGILLPVVIVIATGLGAKRTATLGGSGLTIGLALTVGLITSSLLGYAVSMAQDRHAGILQRLRVTPAPTWMILTSRLIVQVIANLVMAVIVVTVGVVLHGLTPSAGQYALVLAVAMLGAAVFLAIGQAIVGLVNSAGAVNGISRVLFPLLLLLGLLGGTGLLGETFKTIADWSPVGALMTLFSDAMTAPAWSSQDAYSLLACLGYIVVFAFIGIRWFRWDPR
ncbi:ABC transporter permease [Microbacterium sp. STN6]|uniref:ABC transporter permease n=1 Tax=Microbacterium sp. STN6 TaxID=2995588 RepID=UPI002260819F|nr:ABC transporter permease [Microbacterium sp. STN6]MCX7521546.1 ABC transporter permease [Microbacterium sp. STN6]